MASQSVISQSAVGGIGAASAQPGAHATDDGPLIICVLASMMKVSSVVGVEFR